MKNKYKTAYKIVSELSATYFSYFSSHKYSIRYFKGIENFPSVSQSKLFVFKELKNARDYLSKHSMTNPLNQYEIWEVEASNLRKPKKLAQGNVCDIEGYIEENFLKTKRDVEFSFMPKVDVPIGTMQCDSLKFIKSHPME